MNVKSFLFFLYTLSAIVLSFLPLYLDERNFDKVEIGVTMAIALAIGTISNLLFGMLSDKWQTLKSILLFLLCTQLICALVLFMSEQKWLIFIALQCFFMTYTPLASMSDSLILMISRLKNQTYISYRLWGSLGFAIGAVVIGRTLQWSGLDALWLVYGLLSLLTIVLALPLPERKVEQRVIRFQQLATIMKSKTTYLFLIFIFILALSHRMNDHYLGLYLQGMGASETLIGWAWLVSALSEIPMFLILAKFGASFRPLILLAIAACMYSIRFALMAHITEPWMAVLIQGMHSVTFGVFLYAAITWLQTNIPEQFRATGQAIFTITWVSVAGISASAGGGWVFETWSSHVFYYVAASSALLAGVLFFWLALFTNKLKLTSPSTW